MAQLQLNGKCLGFDTLDDMVEYIRTHSRVGTGHVHRIHNLLLAGQTFEVELAVGHAVASHDNGYRSVFQITPRQHMVV
jgi:hypothetical protein